MPRRRCLLRSLTVRFLDIEAAVGALHEGRPTADILAVKYIEALSIMANGMVTKIVVPVEPAAWVGAPAGVAEVQPRASTARR